MAQDLQDWLRAERALRASPVTARMNNVDPQAWLVDVLARTPEISLSHLPELLPWHWKRSLIAKAA